MSIPQSAYVDITSGVGGATVIPERQLIGRFFSDNNLIPPGSYLEFNNEAEVALYFGSTSQEYLRAVMYFSFISKNITKPQTISFSRWVDAAVAPRIYGDITKAQTLGTYTSITTGSFGLTIGGVTNTFTNLDFSGAASLAAVATVLQTAIRTGSGTQWTAATVTYDATRGSFNFVGGQTGAATISVIEGVTGVPVAGLLGWLPAATFVGGNFLNGAITASGAAIETITQTLNTSANASNNFGSFAFIPTLNLSQNIEAATWNKLQNVAYMFTVPVTSANANAWASLSTGLGSIGGTALTLSNVSSEYPEILPMSVLAATDYDRVNSVQNYMFQQANLALTPSVTDLATKNSMDLLRINYYGQTQTAGQLISFYQNGYMLGISTDPLDMNTYANEMWLKNDIEAALLNLLLALARLSANSQGRAQTLATVQGPINRALNNGTISVGKDLTDTQKLFITQVTGSDKAWYQVQTIGYWIDCVIVPSLTTPINYTAKYTLVYSKDDIIRKVVGTDILI